MTLLEKVGDLLLAQHLFLFLKICKCGCEKGIARRNELRLTSKSFDLRLVDVQIDFVVSGELKDGRPALPLPLRLRRRRRVARIGLRSEGDLSPTLLRRWFVFRRSLLGARQHFFEAAHVALQLVDFFDHRLQSRLYRLFNLKKSMI